MIAQAIDRRPMIESFRTHPFTRAVCLEAARLFEQLAAKDSVAAQCRADEGVLNEAQLFQAKARLAQQRARAWHLRARNAPDGLIAMKDEIARNWQNDSYSAEEGPQAHRGTRREAASVAGDKGKQATAKPAMNKRTSGARGLTPCGHF
jgi:hypothetical protein